MVDKFELEMEKSRELGEDETRLGLQDKVDLVGVVYKSIFCNTGCFFSLGLPPKMSIYRKVNLG